MNMVSSFHTNITKLTLIASLTNNKSNLKNRFSIIHPRKQKVKTLKRNFSQIALRKAKSRAESVTKLKESQQRKKKSSESYRRRHTETRESEGDSRNRNRRLVEKKTQENLRESPQLSHKTMSLLESSSTFNSHTSPFQFSSTRLQNDVALKTSTFNPQDFNF